MVSALFAAIFVSVVLSAFHAPAPHGLPVGIAAPPPVISQVQQGLNAAAPGAIDLRAYPSTAVARAAVAHAEVVGALVDSANGMRLLEAKAAGVAPTQVLTTAFSAIAARSGKSLAVSDVVPPLPGDSMALSPFFVVLGVLFPSLVAGSVSALAFRRSGRAWAVAAPAVAAAGIALAATAVADGVAGLGNYIAIAGITALFSLAVAAPTAALVRVRPPLMAAAVLAFVVFGIPASGGPSGLKSFVPGFLRVLHPALPLGAAASAVRSAIYFNGYGAAGPLWALAAWAVAGVAALILLTARRARTTAPVPADTAGAALPDPCDGYDALRPASIVVGFDDSASARRALSRAAAMAASRHENLSIVYADHMLIDSDLSGFGHAEMEADRDARAVAVADAAKGIVAQEGASFTFKRSSQPPADAILAVAGARAAHDESSPVIVVGRSGHAAHHPLGSVPSHLLHHSHYPVLTIP